MLPLEKVLEGKIFPSIMVLLKGKIAGSPPTATRTELKRRVGAGTGSEATDNGRAQQRRPGNET